MRQSIIQTAALICLCFLLTSTGWLSWEYHLIEQVSPQVSDVCTMVAGYALQACGIGIAALVARRQSRLAPSMLAVGLAAHMACMVPAVMSPYLVGTLVFGLLMNVFCGIIAGCYLYALAQLVAPDRKATTFGVGYGVAILGSWLLSVAGGGALYYSEGVLVICLVLTVAAFFVGRACQARLADGEGQRADAGAGANAAAGAGTGVEADESPDKRSGFALLLKAQAAAAAGAAGGAASNRAQSEGRLPAASPTPRSGQPVKPLTRQSVLLAGALVLLFSIVNSSGFAFPTADLGEGVNVELSRLFYAAGLVIAGFVTDKSRKYGAICALAALVFPFIILALRTESFSAVVFWVLSYFTFGFYAVYRIVLFSDIASQRNTLFLAGFGLMIGRVGDAIGKVVNLTLASNLSAMVAVTAVLFAGAVGVFFKLYQVLYVPEAARQQTERERFAQFAAAYDLSAREQDMLRLLLEHKTNGEIAAALSISENTVKFHVRNLLQKTECKNRTDLVAVYETYFL